MPDQSLIEGVRQFAERELQPSAAEVDLERALPPQRWSRLGQAGLAGLLAPADHEGLQADRGTALAAFEVLGGACASTAWALLSHSAVIAGIAALGSDVQKQRYLPDLAQARRVGGALVVTETGGGSNPGSIRSAARVDGDDYVLDGGKFFISQAGAADVYLVMARTDSAPGPGSLSCFIVEKNDAGLSFGEREQTMGLRGVHVAEMYFDSCRLSADRLLGAPGGGMAVLGAIAGMAGRGAAAAALGLAQSALDATSQHLKQRIVLDQPLAAVGGVQGRVARMALELEAARGLLARGLGWIDGGAVGAPLPVWLAKVGVTEAAARVVDQCARLHGAIGYSQELPLERQLRDVRAFAIHWGNNDVLMDMVGKAVLA